MPRDAETGVMLAQSQSKSSTPYALLLRLWSHYSRSTSFPHSSIASSSLLPSIPYSARNKKFSQCINPYSCLTTTSTPASPTASASKRVGPWNHSPVALVMSILTSFCLMVASTRCTNGEWDAGFLPGVRKGGIEQGE